MSSYNTIINRLAMKYRIPVVDMKKLVESQFEFIKETVDSMDFSTVKSEEEFEEMGTNFNVKHLFSFYADYRIVKQINRRRNESTGKSNK